MTGPEALDRERVERLRSGQAWRDFCIALEAAGDLVALEARDDLERAEGYRYLTRLLRSSLERFVENQEAFRPRVRPTPWRVSIAIQSPDQDHPLIEIDGRSEYRIRGTRGSVPYASFLALAAAVPADAGSRPVATPPGSDLEHFDPTALRATGFLSVHDLALEPDGSFTIACSTEEEGPNWLRLEPDSSFIMVRQTFTDRATQEPMTLVVERVPPEPVRPVGASEVARNLAIAAQNVLGSAHRFVGWAHTLAKAPNTLATIDPQYRSSGGSPDHLMYFGSFDLAPDQALVVRFALPPCDTWNFQACSWWAENFDNYEDGDGFVTASTAVPEADGSYRVVCASGPVGAANAIDLFGHHRGLLNLRIVHPGGTAEVSTEVVPLVGRGGVASP